MMPKLDVKSIWMILNVLRLILSLNSLIKSGCSTVNVDYFPLGKMLMSNGNPGVNTFCLSATE